MAVIYSVLSKQFLDGHTCHALVIIFIDLAIGHSIKFDTRIDRAVGVCKELLSIFSSSFKKKPGLTFQV